MAWDLISIAIIKQYCRVETDVDDVLLLGLAQGFCEQAQHICGQQWATADALPMAVRNWILVNTQFLYDNRAALMDSGGGQKVRTFADGLLDPFIKHSS